MLPTIEYELNEVERQISHLRIDFERFFSGELKLMPVQARRRLENVFRRLWGMEIERAADRFRLQALQDRCTSMSELWDKKLRAREEGRRLPPREALGRAATPSDAAATRSGCSSSTAARCVLCCACSSRTASRTSSR